MTTVTLFHGNGSIEQFIEGEGGVKKIQGEHDEVLIELDNGGWLKFLNIPAVVKSTILPEAAKV